MRLRAFAKINLDLRIGGKRPDGFHEIRTILQTIDWFDEICIEPADRLHFSASSTPIDEGNLVLRAVRMFESLTGVAVTARLSLVKNIPVGAGLGGGSADAAVTLLGLQRFFDVSIEAKALWDGLRQLGADVPFFALGGCAVGIGRGDEVYPLADNESSCDYTLVLVQPAVSILTKAAYSWLTDRPKSNSIEGFCAQFLSNRGRGEPANDFEPFAFMRHHELLEIRDGLLRAGAFRAAMSGSGSVMFGQFTTERDAIRAKAELSARYAARLAKPLGRAEYFSRMIEVL